MVREATSLFPSVPQAQTAPFVAPFFKVFVFEAMMCGIVVLSRPLSTVLLQVILMQSSNQITTNNFIRNNPEELSALC